MTRYLSLVFSVLGLALIVGPAFAEEPYTTRIEPRAFYGATVTSEAGVRVFRPLPPTRHVIINPDGETPLILNNRETRVYKYSHHRSLTQNNYGYRSGYGRPGIVVHKGVRMHRY